MLGRADFPPECLQQISTAELNVILATSPPSSVVAMHEISDLDNVLLAPPGYARRWYSHGIGFVVQISEYFLVGTSQEHPEHVRARHRR